MMPEYALFLDILTHYYTYCSFENKKKQLCLIASDASRYPESTKEMVKIIKYDKNFDKYEKNTHYTPWHFQKPKP